VPDRRADAIDACALWTRLPARYRAPMADTIRAELMVTGKVQGVFFRASAFEEAQRLGLVGFVQNLPDGSVESVVEGDRSQVEDYVSWCRRGPTAARVEDVIVRFVPPKAEFRTFRIER
jgi:acylphosphatase